MPIKRGRWMSPRKIAFANSAGRGIGNDCAIELARHGANVIINDGNGLAESNHERQRPIVDLSIAKNGPNLPDGQFETCRVQARRPGLHVMTQSLQLGRE
jgi:NAD(P)-dependent dehydrogenase (short-subunit alcohol dehydrogenase family)